MLRIQTATLFLPRTYSQTFIPSTDDLTIANRVRSEPVKRRYRVKSKRLRHSDDKLLSLMTDLRSPAVFLMDTHQHDWHK